MGYVEDRVAEVEKVIDTRLGPNEIYAAIQRSAVAAKVAAGGGKLQELARQEQQDGSDAVYFAVLMGIGVERGRIAVRWWPDRPGRHRVKVHVISYDTSQVAPLAPKTVPILRCVRRFVDALKVELRKAPAQGAAAPTETSTQVAPVTGDPTDEETDRIVELVERGMSGGTLSDAELRELEAAGITAVYEPARGVDERARRSGPASGANPSMAEARRRLVEEGFIDESAEGSAEQSSGETERPATVDRPHAPPIALDAGSAEDDVARCAGCGSEVGGGDRFCRKCGFELAGERSPVRHDPPDGRELDALVRKAERAQAAGVLVQAAVLTIHQVKRIIDEAGRAGSLFGDARARAMQSANRGEFLAVGYCFRTIRNLMVRDRLQGGRLEGMSKADEATVATIGSGAALGYVMAKSLDEADRKVLLVPWLRAVGEPPPSDDLVQLAVDDSRTRPTTASLPTTPADPGLRTSVQRSSNYPAPQRATRQPPPRTAAPRARASPRYVSDAQIGENFTVRQVVDGLCWMIAGIAAVVFGTQPEYSSVWVILIGIAAVIYGLRVLFAGGSYWVSNVVYLITILTVTAAFAAAFSPYGSSSGSSSSPPPVEDDTGPLPSSGATTQSRDTVNALDLELSDEFCDSYGSLIAYLESGFGHEYDDFSLLLEQARAAAPSELLPALQRYGSARLAFIADGSYDEALYNQWDSALVYLMSQVGDAC